MYSKLGNVVVVDTNVHDERFIWIITFKCLKALESYVKSAVTFERAVSFDGAVQ